MPLLSIEDQVIAALRRISQAIDLHSQGLMQHSGLSAPQLAALRAIGRLQPISVGALANAIHLSQTTLTGILTRLENRALISRVASPSAHQVVVELTRQGHAVVDTAPSVLHDHFHREFKKLEDSERTEMLAVLQRIASMMQADDVEAAPGLGAGAAAADDDRGSQILDESVVPGENEEHAQPDCPGDSVAVSAGRGGCETDFGQLSM